MGKRINNDNFGSLDDRPKLIKYLKLAWKNSNKLVVELLTAKTL